jgi:hypothetical protein
MSRLLGSAPHRSRGVLYEDQNEAGHILWVQEWAIRNELESYLSSDEFLTVLGGFQVLGIMHDCRVVDLSTNISHGGRPVRTVRALSGWRQFDEPGENEAS